MARSRGVTVRASMPRATRGATRTAALGSPDRLARDNEHDLSQFLGSDLRAPNRLQGESPQRVVQPLGFSRPLDCGVKNETQGEDTPNPMDKRSQRDRT